VVPNSGYNVGANGQDGAPVPKPQASRLNLDEPKPDGKPDPISDFRANFKSLMDAVAEFGEARIDGVRLAARETVLKLILGAFGGLAAAAFLVVSMALLLLGLSGGVSRLLGTGPWAGHLLVGLLGVGLPMTILILKTRSLKKQWLEKVKTKYAERTEIQCEK
jgi:TM2 domain-containing membrane protein YozV